MSPEGGDPGRAAWRSAGARAVPTDKAALGHVAASRGRCSCPPRGPRAAAEKAHGSHGDPSTPEAPPGPAGAAEAAARAPPWRMLGPPTRGPAMARAGLVPQPLLLRELRPPWPPRRPHRSARPPPGSQRTPAWRPPTRSPPRAPDGRASSVTDRASSSASSAPTESGNGSSNQRRPTWPRPLPACCFLEELRAFHPR